MATFLEYELDDGTTLLVRVADKEAGGFEKAARGDDGNVIVKAGKRFSEALAGVKAQATALRQNLDELKADEVEVTFSLTASGELGNFAIGNVGVEANYEVTLKWANAPAAK